MSEPNHYPLDYPLDAPGHYPRMEVHAGLGRIQEHGDPSHPLAQAYQQWLKTSGQKEQSIADEEYQATCFLPAFGPPVIVLRGSAVEPLSRNVGVGLTISGNTQDGEFSLLCPQYYVRIHSKRGEAIPWAIAKPWNQPIVISYGAPRPVTSVRAIINNFDFENGDQDEASSSNRSAPDGILRVEADGRPVEFSWRRDREPLRRLVASGMLPTAAFTEFSFGAWPEASDEELVTFARDVASLCSYTIGQHTGISVFSLMDASGHIVRRIVGQAVESEYRRGGILATSEVPEGLERLFQLCFAEHVRMRKSSLPWKRLPYVCACIEDAPYLEQKFASLMMALEFFLKNILIEDGRISDEKIEKMTLENLINAARGVLRWDIPKHYTPKKLFPQLRNAVMHGGELPTANATEFRHTFDKWRLFLDRRILMRLGYDGQVACPQRGYAAVSAVDDFREEYNSLR